MCTTIKAAFAIGSVLLFAGFLQADDQADSNKLIDKAITALGGEAAVAKLRQLSWKGTGTARGEVMEFGLTHEGSVQGWDRARLDLTLDINENRIAVLLVVNGANVWSKGKGQGEAGELPKEIAAILRENLQALRLPQVLPELTKPGVKLSPLGEIQIGARPALGINVVREGRRDINLWLDKESGLPIKTEVRVADTTGQEVLCYFMYDDYKDFEGRKQFMKLSFDYAGRVSFTTELSEVQPQEQLDESEFGKP